MPENYIALFDAPEEAEARKIIAAAQPALERGIGCIRSGRDFPAVKGGRCTHCMACICGCPAGAIEYGTASRGKPRYQCPEYEK